MSVSKHLLLGGWYTRGPQVHQQRYRPIDSNKTVYIKWWRIAVGEIEGTINDI